MTVESLKTKEIYLGNGKNTTFPVPFPYATPDDIHLLLTDDDGEDVEITSNFTIALSQSGDTSVNYPERGTPLLEGQKLTVYRNTQRTQIVSLSDVGEFSPEELEKSGFDRTVMMIQELQEEVDRSIKVSRDTYETPEEFIEELFSKQEQAVQAEKRAEQAFASATNQASIAIDKANKSSAFAQSALHAAESAVNAAKTIEGFAHATQAFHGLYIDENLHLIGVKAEDGDTVNSEDFFHYAILPTEARFFLEGGKLALELPFTQ